MKDRLGVYLKRARTKRHNTLKEASQSTGISEAYISQLENGKRGVPTIAILVILSKFYRVDFKRTLSMAGLTYLEKVKRGKEN